MCSLSHPRSVSHPVFCSSQGLTLQATSQLCSSQASSRIWVEKRGRAVVSPHAACPPTPRGHCSPGHTPFSGRARPPRLPGNHPFPPGPTWALVKLLRVAAGTCRARRPAGALRLTLSLWKLLGSGGQGREPVFLHRAGLWQVGAAVSRQGGKVSRAGLHAQHPEAQRRAGGSTGREEADVGGHGAGCGAAVERALLSCRRPAAQGRVGAGQVPSPGSAGTQKGEAHSLGASCLSGRDHA